jgi:hypothetical protein
VGSDRRLSKDYEYLTAEQRDDDLRGDESICAAMVCVQRSVGVASTQRVGLKH